MASTWQGMAMNRPGELQFAGSLGDTSMHRHAAVQVIEVTSGSVVLRDGTGAERTGTRAVIPTGAAHAIRAVGPTEGTITYVDPDQRHAQTYAARLREVGLDPSAVTTWVGSTDLADGAAARNEPVHPMLVAAITAAPGLVDGPLLLKDLATQVGMSPSRLGHLFAEELGLSFPAWRRWTRLRHALGAVLEGADLTTAAHGAGFADSAHLSRVCREMFGITPSEALLAMRPTGRHPA